MTMIWAKLWYSTCTCMQMIRACSSSIKTHFAFNVRQPKGLIFLTRLRVGLSHLREHKFKYSFLDTLNPICTGGSDIKTLNHFFLHCPRFTNERQNLLLKIERIIPDILIKDDTNITSILLYGDPSFSAELNTNILNVSIDYILSTKRFKSTLFTKTWFMSYIFKIIVSQLTRFARFFY